MVVTAAEQRPILQVQPVGLTACTVVVAGTSSRGTAARRIATDMRLASASSTSASALCSPNNNLIPGYKQMDEILEDV